MLGLWGEVVQITEEKEDIQFLTIRMKESRKTISAIYYRSFGERCALGDWVKVNISSLKLNLGTGGYGFVIAKNDSKEELATDSDQFPGHIMKLRYTPWQTPVLACEAPESKHHPLFKEPFDLNGKYVFLGELHSMLPILVSLLKRRDAKRKVAYIMDDQAALFSSFSHHLRYLQEELDVTAITYGQSTGGDLECINVYTALEAAYKVVQADDIIITQGPGGVGTRTTRGFSGMQIIHWLHAVHTCGGRALIIPRIQFKDKRPRHLGLSEHTWYPLSKHALASATLAYPYFKSKPCEQDHILRQQFKHLEDKHVIVPVPIESFYPELEQSLAWYGRPIKMMGKNYKDEAYFFYAVGASFQLYMEQLIPIE